nr:MAG TPA: hypothetical protein [Caudoviricetes sp.]
MTSNDKMLSQFGADWVKVKNYITARDSEVVPYMPWFMVHIEKVTGVTANTVKSILDYGLQIGLFKKTLDRDFITLSPVNRKE